MSLWGSFKRRLKRIRSKYRSSSDGGPATPAPLASQQQTLSTSIVLANLTNDGEHVIQPSAPPATPHIPAQLDRDDDVVRDEPDHDNDRSCSEQVASALGEQAPATPEQNEQVQKSRSLWTQAYYNLDPGLVKEYNELLTKAFCETDSLPDDVTAHAIGTSADIAGYNTATLTGPSVELAAEIEAGQRRMHDTFKETYPDYIKGVAKHGEVLRESRKMRFYIGHHEVILRDWIAKASNLVLWGKPLVDEAVKPSSEASLVWAGVCLILPLLTNRVLAEDAQRSGFDYVTARMEFYLALEPYLLQRSASVDITEDLLRVLEKDIMNLYQLILELQFKSVIRLYGRWWGRIVQDTTNPAQWGEMVSGVKEAERILDADLQKLSNLRKTDYLETLSQRAKTLSDTMNQLVSGLRLTQEEQVEQQKLTNKLLGEINLPIVPDALHDTLKDGHVCLEHTRTSVLKRIREWADYEESPTILWLNGPAGTGKSTIARTIAYVFSDQDQLGGSYFFDQNSGRTGLERFFPTIANRLVATIPGFGDRLRSSLEELGNPKEEAKNITTKAIEEQFKRLIKNPLAELPPSHPNTLERIIVVDALDECADRTRIQLICRLFAQLHGLPAIRIRVLLTSRPDPYIETSLQESYYYGLSLLDANLGHEAKQDILLFLQSRFKDIRRNFGIKEDPWPDQDDSVRLFNMATQPSPLFIYAETLYRFVKNGQRHPKAQLTMWLSQSV